MHFKRLPRLEVRLELYFKTEKQLLWICIGMLLIVKRRLHKTEIKLYDFTTRDTPNVLLMFACLNMEVGMIHALARDFFICILFGSR